MPYVAKIKRDDPFRIADRREIETMVERIAAACEPFSIASREESGPRVMTKIKVFPRQTDCNS